MRVIELIAPIWQSFYSRELYRDVVYAWRGTGAAYLLLVLALCWLPSCAGIYRGLHELATEHAPGIVRQLPTITIRDGVMSAHPPGVHVVQLVGGGEEAEGLVLHVDDRIDHVPADMPGNTLALTRREIGVIRANRHERRIWTLTQGTEIILPPERVASFLTSLRYWVPPFFYVLCVAGSFALRGLQVVLYGAVGRWLIAGRGMLDSRAAWRLAAVAMTPMIVIRTFLSTGSWEPQWYLLWPVGVAVTLAYLAFGIRAAAPFYSNGSPPLANRGGMLS